jgi:Tol biopolymer transport system component/DNA-binding winged helix-turn-helix (wHTH) protein
MTGPPALHRNGQFVSITPKALAILTVLVSNRGNPVSKEDLLATVWSDTAVGDGILSQNVYTLRRLLGPDFPDRNPIENVPRFGYRFSVTVELDENGLESNAAPEPTSVPVESGSVSAEVSDDAVPIAASRAKGRGTFHFKRWMLSIPVVLSLLVFGLVYARNLRSAKESKMEFVRFTANTNDNRVTAAAISPDGQRIAYADVDGVVLRGAHDISAHNVRTPELRRVERLAWSPDGLHLLVSGSSVSGLQQLWMLSTTGEAPRLLKDHARLGTISPDGSRIAYVADTGSEVWIVDPAGENARQVFAGSPNDTFPVVQWSADGKRLLLERHTAFQSDGHFHSPRTEDEIEGFHPTYLAVDVASGRITASQDAVRIGSACLLAPDLMLFSRSEDTDVGNSTSFWKVAINPYTGAFVSAPRRIQDLYSERLLTLSVAARTGAVAAVFSHGQPGIYVGSLHLETGKLDNVKLLTAGQGGPHAWTPDSSAVLFESNNLDLHHYHIYKQDVTRHEPESLVANMGGEFLPRLTPDRRSILFESKSKDGITSIWRVALAGGPPVLIHQGRSIEYRCPLSGSYCVLGTLLDSQHFAFSALDIVQGKRQKLFTMPASWDAHGDWDVSPDGSQVAAVSPLSSQPEIRVAELTSGKTQELLLPMTTAVRAINWLPSGKGWIVATSTASGNELVYVDAKGTPRPLRETANYSWGVPSPDGTRLAFADKDLDSNVWLLPAHTQN